MSNEILIFAQVTRKGFVHPVFFELASKAVELSEKLNNAPVSAIVFVPAGGFDDIKEGFCINGIDKVYVFEDESFKNYSTETFANLTVKLIQEVQPEIFLIGATSVGRDLAPRISSMLHTGLTADCTGLDINEKDLLCATRPTFGGQLMATILCKTKPQMATVRPNVFKPLKTQIHKNTEFVYREVLPADILDNVKILEFIENIKNEYNDLNSSEIIVAGGKGMKNQAGFELLQEFAKKIGGTVGASRGAVEAGFASAEIQVGQTGKTVSPKLYIACGISGAIQHVCGMENSEFIIAINKDERAPIFEVADIGIVGDVFEVLPKLQELLSDKIK